MVAAPATPPPTATGTPDGAAALPGAAPLAPKAGLHPRNRWRTGYDFAALAAVEPRLAAHLRRNPAGAPTIDFADPAAVRALNRALLRRDYGLDGWSLPPGYLCPPIPGRADYVHQVADLLAGDPAAGGAVPRGAAVRVWDLGVGASCVYPIIGYYEYGWSFVGSECAAAALRSAAAIRAANPGLAGAVELRRQPDPQQVFRGVAQPGERFAALMCNPPFHASPAAAAAGTVRKMRQLAGRTLPRATAPRLNFGGRNHELVCAGGELGFIYRLIAESAECPTLCGWFTCLVVKSEHLPSLTEALRRVRARTVRVVPMAQGQKRSRFLAWQF